MNSMRNRNRPSTSLLSLAVVILSFVSGGSLSAGKDVDGDYIFLEIPRAAEPIGLVLTWAGDGTYKIIGYFYMGRRDLRGDEESDGFWTPGEREWDWDEDFEIRTVSIV
jgi:hypothetical protein